MFLGELEYTLDEKNRVVLPSTLRRGIAEEVLRDRFYLVPSDEDRCLELRPRESWESHVQRLEELHDFGDPEWQEYLRDVFSAASEIQLDKQCRFLLPEASKTAAGIDRDVYFIGFKEYIEIWAKERWEERRAQRRGKRLNPLRVRRT